MDFSEINLYGKTNLGSLLKEIHKNSQDKEQELKKLINELKPYISSAGDAVILVPLITKYMEASIKNDDNLIKMVGIVQRAYNSANKSNSDDLQLTDDEKEQLLRNVQELKIV
jgi:signal transduction histidine kinase